jgi:dienelactone hydrolase
LSIPELSMRKIIILCGFLIFLTGKSQTVTELSESFLKKMTREQFDSCEVYFDTSVTDKINSGVMSDVWAQIPRYVGDYRSYDNIRTEKIGDTLDVVIIQCAFEKTKLDLRFVYNKLKKIIGLLFIPPKSKNTYNPPEYYIPSKLYETKLAVKTGTFEMPGILCVPNNVTDPPVVILIAGSGANDKDETAGPLKALKDIALGLASNGIASLRYDKRTYTYGNKLPKDKTGINEEVIEDALSAVKILRAHALTKESKIFVAGHSLGAMCAPLIATKSKDISAIIMLAGNARSLEDLVLDQYTYFSTLDSNDTNIKQAIEKIKIQNETVKDPKKLKKAETKDLPLEIPSFYWQSIKNYDQVKTAKKVKQPILILQGERDYQVTTKEFNIWKKELSTDPKNKFITYPSLNHMFMKGEGKSTPAEYDEPNNVEEKVILDMVEFVKALK